MNKFCPAGNCECECFNQHFGELYCTFKIGGILEEERIEELRLEVCPWPSRQQPKAETVVVAVELYRTQKEGYTAGRVEQARLDREAVNELYLGWGTRVRKSVLAALKAQEVKDE